MKVLTLNPTVETGIIGFTLFKLKKYVYIFSDTTLQQISAGFCHVCNSLPCGEQAAY